MSAAAAWLAPSVLREALLEGPAGGDLVGEALVGLLTAAGLLARPDFVERCVDLDAEGWADFDPSALRAAAGGGSGLEFTGVERRLLAVAVAMTALGGALYWLDGEPRVWATAAVLASVGHGGSAESVVVVEGVDQGEPPLAQWESPDGGCFATGPLARMLAAFEAAGGER